MAAKKKKKKTSPPKIRRGWGINPKTRVTPSKKQELKEKEERKKIRAWEAEGFAE
jgi:hypothetical protein